MADDLTAKLMSAMRIVALDDVMTTAVKLMEELRSLSAVVDKRDVDIAAEAMALHRLSIGIDRLQHHVARARDAKLAKLRDGQKWTIGRIAKHTAIERTLVQKMVRRGRALR